MLAHLGSELVSTVHGLCRMHRGVWEILLYPWARQDRRGVCAKRIIGSFPRGGQCRYARCALHRKGSIPSLALRVGKEYPKMRIRKIYAKKE